MPWREVAGCGSEPFGWALLYYMETTLILARIVSHVWARGCSKKSLEEPSCFFPELSNEKITTTTCSVVPKKLAALWSLVSMRAGFPWAMR